MFQRDGQKTNNREFFISELSVCVKKQRYRNVFVERTHCQGALAHVGGDEPVDGSVLCVP